MAPPDVREPEMSVETDEFLHGLFGYDEDSDEGPYVNWTNGFESSDEEYEEYTAQDNSNNNGGGWWRFWDKD
jgi:hypothetical protein